MKFEKIKKIIGIAILIMRESIKSFLKNNDFEMSAALATYGFFSLIPLFFFIAYLLGNYAFLSQTIMSGIENLIAHLFPQLNKFTTKEFYFSTEHKVIWGVVSLSIVFVSIMSLTDSLRTAFIKIFNIDREISLIRSQFLNAVAALIILILFFVLMVGEILYSGITVMLLKNASSLINITGIIASLIVATLCMCIFYITFLPVRLRINRLLTVSLVSAFLIIFMRDLFSIFITFNPSYGLAFGSLKTLFIMIIWVYYCFLVILFGAETMVNISKRDALLLKGLFLDDSTSLKAPKMLIKKFIKRYNTGEIVFAEGEKGNNMFYIISGSINISKNEQIIRVMKKGEYFGEMSMLVNTLRTATAIAAEPDTQLVSISHDNFDVILRENPKIVLSILKEMTSRLKMTNENI